MPSLPVALLLIWAGFLAYFDLRSRRIPNVLSLGAWGVAIICLAVNQRSLLGESAGSALLGALFGAAVTVHAYAMRKLGAGDVKMLVAIGLMTSLPRTLECFVVAGVVGLLLSMLWLVLERMRDTLEAAPGLPEALRSWALIRLSDRKMAYGALFSIGLAVSLQLKLTT
jgi:prepilin peptidase CpaA